MKILFAASEAYPIVKTGGLGDVIYSLPRALHAKGLDVRVILPAYRVVLEQIDHMHISGWFEVRGAHINHAVRILETNDNHLGVPLLLVDAPHLFDRPGNPYLHPGGYNWHDNAERFTVFSRAVAQMVQHPEILDWKPDVVHCHDWQTGLIPALLSEVEDAPKTMFTIHNLSYSGMFPHEEFMRLGFPTSWWSPDALEFFGNFSMLKGGIVFADQVTTVSPSYAQEIRTPGHGYGFDGVLRANAHKLHGILNGIDDLVWNPATDPMLPERYKLKRNCISGKHTNKEHLLREVGLPYDAENLQKPVMALISRLVEQKGIDLLLGAMPRLMAETDAMLIVLGSGDKNFEHQLELLAKEYPQRIKLILGYHEELSHRIEAGADMFLMPSRFEPCGLNQLYSLKYGTPPVVHHVGGLADTVVDATKENLAEGTATGFVFYHPTVDDFRSAIERALQLYRTTVWRQLIRNAMAQDFGWDKSAAQYVQLYESSL